MDNVNTYISILRSSLQKKFTLIKELLELTKEQNVLLSEKEMDVEAFDDIVDKKEVRINEVLEIDKGFQSLFDKMGAAIKERPQEYRPQILELQNLIRTIVDMGVEIESLEQKNKAKFNKFLVEKREDIKNFKVSNKTAVSYYKNMSNQHREWQSYFFDKKK